MTDPTETGSHSETETGRSERRSRQKASPRRVLHETRAAAAVAARVEGLTYEAIGKRVGVGTSQAHTLVRDELARIVAERTEDAAHALQLELARLDLALRRVLDIVSGERVAPALRLRAVDSLIRVGERRSKLLGLDAPSKVKVVEVDPFEGLTLEEIQFIAEHRGELPPGCRVNGRRVERVAVAPALPPVAPTETA